MKKRTTTCLFFAAMTAMLILTTGCARKHIVSSPPTEEPAKQVEVTPAPQPEAAQEQPGLIDETYEVDAPEEAGAPEAKIEESDLAEDVTPAPAKVDGEMAEPAKTEVQEANEMKEEAAAAAVATPEAEAAAKPVEEQTAADVSEPEVEEEATPLTGMYYVQIGAFSDLENANRALARLLSDGYKGSRLSKMDDGLFRVQAGAFPDETSAGEALSKLLTDYPKGFVLKQD